MRDTLYDDTPMEKFPPSDEQAAVFPWSKFIEARGYYAAKKVDEAIVCWRDLLAAPNLEPRVYGQAWHYLRANGVHPVGDHSKLLLGVVVELGMPKGLDLLAVYPDYAARYYNFSGSAVIWEHPDKSLNKIIDSVFEAAVQAILQLSPSPSARPPSPSTNQVRISFLTPSGIHLAEGPIVEVSRSPVAGPVFHLAGELLRALVQKTAKK